MLEYFTAYSGELYKTVRKTIGFRRLWFLHDLNSTFYRLGTQVSPATNAIRAENGAMKKPCVEFSPRGPPGQLPPTRESKPGSRGVSFTIRVCPDCDSFQVPDYPSPQALQMRIPLPRRFCMTPRFAHAARGGSLVRLAGLCLSKPRNLRRNMGHSQVALLQFLRVLSFGSRRHA